jgi:hypothetical protein
MLEYIYYLLQAHDDELMAFCRKVANSIQHRSPETAQAISNAFLPSKGTACSSYKIYISQMNKYYTNTNNINYLIAKCRYQASKTITNLLCDFEYLFEISFPLYCSNLIKYTNIKKHSIVQNVCPFCILDN